MLISKDFFAKGIEIDTKKDFSDACHSNHVKWEKHPD